MTEQKPDKKVSNKTETKTKTNYVNCQNCGKKIDSGKFCSDICEKVYNKEPKGAKPLQAVEEQNKVKKFCKECGKPIRDDLTFCSAKCIHEYRYKQEHPEDTLTNALGETIIKSSVEVEESATEYMRRRQKEKKSGKTKQTEVKNNENNKVRNDLDFQILLSGDGMQRRDHNIDVIKNYALSGLSFNEIWKRVRRKLTSRKLEEYYNIVLDEINGERLK